MVFSSITFIFYFLPAFLLTYLALPRWRNGILLAFSLFFYAWGEVFYILLMLACIGVNYLVALGIDRPGPEAARRNWLLAGVAANLLILFFFKYFTFAVATLERILQAHLSIPASLRSLPLPVGLSFFTFQGMSYVMDVYRSRVPAQRSVLKLATYISMFPQLVAGPIVRYETIARELEERSVTWAGFNRGVHLFVWGLAAKVLLANSLAVPADAVFSGDPGDLSAAAAWFGALCYALQIYFDFSGYSTMAIGLGLMVGFHFCENFNRPYVSQSITEFWRRWHISLSTWFRDYLYIPLGGSRASRLITYRNLMLVFLLCGAWHGAQWTFVVWGVYHGFFLLLERSPRGQGGLRRLPRPLRHAYALLVVLVSWVLFRADSVQHAAAYLKTMAGFPAGRGWNTVEVFLSPVAALALAAGLLAVAVNWSETALFRMMRDESDRAEGVLLPLVRGGVTVALFAACAMAMASGTHNPFIYYRF